MPSQTNLLHVLEGNSPGCRASPATRLQNGLTRHQGAAGVYASAPRHFPPSTGGAKIHGDYRDDITHNSLHTHHPAGSDNATVRIRNADDCHIASNEIISHSPGTIPNAIRISTEGALLEPATNWTITDNRIRGDAGDGAYTDGVTVAPAAAPVVGVTVSGNVFQGCVNQIRWNGSPALYVEIPTASGNSGAASDFADLANVEAVRIAGNTGSQADYVYAADDEPQFPAADGSLARRRIGGGVNSTLYVRESGSWRGL